MNELIDLFQIQLESQRNNEMVHRLEPTRCHEVHALYEKTATRLRNSDTLDKSITHQSLNLVNGIRRIVSTCAIQSIRLEKGWHCRRVDPATRQIRWIEHNDIKGLITLRKSTKIHSIQSQVMS